VQPSVVAAGWVVALIRELTSADADAYVVLRRAALEEAPLAFASSPRDDVASSADAIRERLQQTPHGTIFGAFQPDLVATVGMFRDRYVKSSHKCHVWGMYVAPAVRRQGIGLALLNAMLRHARELGGVSWVYLSVSSASPEAEQLYQRVGFHVWGTEPAALRYDGETVVEHHMALCLE